MTKPLSTVAESIVALRKAYGHDYVPKGFGVWDLAYCDDEKLLRPHLDTSPPKQAKSNGR